MKQYEVLLGRQPIFDADGTIHGYELLVAAEQTAMSTGVPSELSGEGNAIGPDSVLKLVDLGIERLVGDHPLQLKALPSLLVGDAWDLLPPERTTFLVRAEDVESEGFVDACKKVKSEGYGIAATQEIFDPKCSELLELVQVLWLDCNNLEIPFIEQAISYCSGTGKVAGAVDVNLRQELDECAEMGFGLFQGYLLSLPQIVTGRTMKGNQLSKMRLLTALLDEESDIKELEQIVRADPAMTRQILQMASGIGGSRIKRQVRTIRDAMVFAGLRRLRSWVALLIVADQGRATEEQLVTALVRARGSELLAQSLDPAVAEIAFTAGMLSSFDLLLGMELDAALSSFEVSSELISAAKCQGRVGSMIADVIDFQRARFSLAVRSGATRAVLQSATTEALSWAVQSTSAIGESKAALAW